jgi:hypothetical protein
VGGTPIWRARRGAYGGPMASGQSSTHAFEDSLRCGDVSPPTVVVLLKGGPAEPGFCHGPVVVA